MKKLIRFSAIFGILAALATIAAAYWHQGTGDGAAPPSRSPHPQAPSKMIAMGPVGTQIVSSEQIGNVLIKITASRLWIKKSKTFGFDNALLKKMAASDFCLTISKAGKVILSASKDLVEMPANLSIITIRDPKVLYPVNIDQPDSIRFDKPNMTVSFKRGASEETWELSQN